MIENVITKKDMKLQGLYLVSTPIGNLKDITMRAIETLQNADFIACEDSRVTGKLKKAYNIDTKLIKYNDHSTDEARANLINILNSGKSIALVSDAGTPLISDPGYKLVNNCYENNIKVNAIPGVSASIMAFTLSGLPMDNFFFSGFLPSKEHARIKKLNDIKNIEATIGIYESAKRLTSSLKNIYQILGDRNIAVVRELTKKFEEVKRGKISELISHYEEAGNPKGEIVIVIEGYNATSDNLSIEQIESELKELIFTNKMKTKDAVKHLENVTALNKKELYNIAIKIKENG